MHEINKETHDHRRAVENTFRKELVRKDRKYQKKAYEQLEVYKKTALLNLAMMKDELSIQNIGKAHLSIRHEKQKKMLADCDRDFEVITKNVSFFNQSSYL